MDKIILRKKMLEKRNSLSKNFITESELLVFEKITSTNILNFEEFLLYSSFKNEMPVHKLTQYLLSKGRRVFLPKCNTVNLTFEAVEIFEKQTEYSINKYGISEPIQLDKHKDFKIDCAIVPGVVFDKKCNRIGFGAGYYDKFLSKNNHIYKIGICYEFQVINSIDADVHDICMDAVITEKNIYLGPVDR